LLLLNNNHYLLIINKINAFLIESQGKKINEEIPLTGETEENLVSRNKYGLVWQVRLPY